MTRREREAVMELLLCAADCWHSQQGGIGVAAVNIYGDDVESPPAWGLAIRAWDDTAEVYSTFAGVTYGDVCLEAAERIRLGEWP